MIHLELDKLAQKHLDFSNQLGDLFTAVSNAVKDKGLTRRKVSPLPPPSSLLSLAPPLSPLSPPVFCDCDHSDSLLFRSRALRCLPPTAGANGHAVHNRAECRYCCQQQGTVALAPLVLCFALPRPHSRRGASTQQARANYESKCKAADSAQQAFQKAKLDGNIKPKEVTKVTASVRSPLPSPSLHYEMRQARSILHDLTLLLHSSRFQIALHLPPA